MTAIELAQLVADMRAIQRVYFKERKYTQLKEAMKKEQEVDTMVKEILDDIPESQPGMEP